MIDETEILKVSGIAKILYDKRPAVELGPGQEWATWAAICEAITQLLPTGG